MAVEFCFLNTFGKGQTQSSKLVKLIKSKVSAIINVFFNMTNPVGIIKDFIEIYCI